MLEENLDLLSVIAAAKVVKLEKDLCGKIMGELDGMELGSGFAILWVVEMAAWKMCVPPYKIVDEEPRQKADGRHRQGP